MNAHPSVALVFGLATVLVACPKDKEETGEPSVDGWEYIAVTWSTDYYLLDPSSGEERYQISPLEEGMTDLLYPSIAGDGETLYFTSIPADASHHELFSCDLTTGAGLTRHTTFDYAGLGEPDASPVDGRVVFHAAETGGTTSIYLVDPDAGSPSALSAAEDPLEISSSGYTTVSWGDTYPVWSPDGSQVAFYRYAHADDGYFDVIVGMSPDGSDPYEIYSQPRDDGFRDLCWTSDGQWIVLTTGAQNDSAKSVKAVDVSQGTIVDLSAAFSGYTVQDHACSASSMAVVFTDIEVAPNLYVATLDAAGGTLSVSGIAALTTDGAYRYPDWAGNDEGGSPPDDPGPEDTGGPGAPDEVIAATWSDGYYLVEPSTGVEWYEVHPLDSGMTDLLEPSISGDGTRIYFRSIPSGEDFHELYGADLVTGDNLTRYTTFQYAGLAEPDASPTASTVLFQGAETGSAVCIYKLDSSGNVSALTHAEDALAISLTAAVTESWGDYYPVFSPDGTQAAFYRYAHSTDGYFDLVVGLDPDSGATWEIYAQPRDDGLRDLCWTADGQTILATTGALNDSGKSLLAIHVDDGTVTDLTAGLTGYTVQDHACSPTSQSFTFTDIVVSPYLYLATLEETGGVLSISSVSQIGDQAHYRSPDWGLMP